MDTIKFYLAGALFSFTDSLMRLEGVINLKWAYNPHLKQENNKRNIRHSKTAPKGRVQQSV